MKSKALEATAGLESSAGFMDELIAEVAPPEDVITVHLGGKTLTFRAIIDRMELRKLQKEAGKFAELTPDKVPVEANRPFYETDSETMALAFVLAKTSIEPKLQPLDLLKLAKKAALAFESLKDMVNAGHSRKTAIVDANESEQAKNE